MTLARVLAIGLDIEEIVRDVNGRRAQAKRDKGPDRSHPEIGLENTVGGDQRQKHQEVLDPLVGTQGSNGRRKRLCGGTIA